MPELPEVETTRLGLLPHVRGQRIERVTVRERRLRWPIPANFTDLLQGTTVSNIIRRGKYLLWDCERGSSAMNHKFEGMDSGFMLSHLGMSGTLRVLSSATPVAKHDHVDIEFANKVLIRFNDPRRFGAMLWIAGRDMVHPLLDVLGPEPLSDAFTAQHLFKASRGRSVSIKEFIMNGHVVVGVGNIYAAESLFRAGIHPQRAAGKTSLLRYEKLVDAIRETLQDALRAGGTTLRDYVKTDGEQGYFQLDAAVYGRNGDACRICGTPIRLMVQGQRSTYFCPRCQH